MHSLSLKGFGNINARARRCFPSEASLRRGWLNCGRELSRNCRIVASSLAAVREEEGAGGQRERGGQEFKLELQLASSFLTRSQTYALLKQQVEVVAKSEVMV